MNQNVFCSQPRFFVVLNHLFGFAVFFTLFIVPHALNAQNPTLVWAKTYGGSKVEGARSIVVTKDNKYLVAGWTSSFDGDVDSTRNLLSDAWLLKLNEDGSILWKKNYGGSGDEGIYSIIQTLDNGFIMVGSTSSADIVENKGEEDAWVIKIDSTGNVQWQKTFGGSNRESLWSVFQTKNGDYIMGGYSNSNDKDFPENSGLWDMWILKLNSQGNLVWKKRLGGSQDDLLSGITNIDDKTFAIAGRTDSRNGDMVGALGDFSVKMDSSGKVVWKKSFGYYNEPEGLKVFYGISMSKGRMVSVGGKIVNHSVPNRPYSWNYLITKSDTAGNFLWSKLFGGTQSETAKSVQTLPNGDLLIVGYTQSDDLDITGNHGDLDFWVVQTDSSGNFKNANCYGGTLEDQPFASAIDKQGNLIVAGVSRSTNGLFTQNKGLFDLAVIKLKYNLTSTKELEHEEDIVVYPNPVNDELILKVPPNVNPVFRLYDIAGKLVYQSKKEEVISAIDMHNLPQGFYMLTYLLGNTSHTKKICKM